jgi:hypothetical protein
MNAESLPLPAGFVGGLAVPITIGYLARQTRQTRSLLEQATRQQTASFVERVEAVESARG